MIVQTTKGPMDDSLLRYKLDEEQRPQGRRIAHEYYLGDELVHRSVEFTINKDLVTPELLKTLGVPPGNMDLKE
jgi:hypothetical protein